MMEVIRVLELDELVTALEPPMLDTSSGQLRLRCVADSDKATGWVTVREGSGTSAQLHLTPAVEDAKLKAAPSTPPMGSDGKGWNKTGDKNGSKGSSKGKKPPWHAKEEADEIGVKAKGPKGKGKG